MGLKNSGCGEIVEVEGGHNMRSVGGKDRHSKVCTSKGPRDRRVRLAAHTAIQFYDVQDRLGYDRPSKAVDWLIKKAKAAIDELGELPSWHPTTITESSFPNDNASGLVQEDDEAKKKLEAEDQNRHEQLDVVDLAASGKRAAMAVLGGEDEQQRLTKHRETLNGLRCDQDSSFLPPSLDSDSIADTIKSFFPMGASAESSSSSSMHFQGFAVHDWLSRTSSHTQDLRLSLQSLQGPVLLQHGDEAHHQHQNDHTNSPALLCGTPISFDAATLWPGQHHRHLSNNLLELNRFQKIQSWNVGGDENQVDNPTQSVVSQHLLHHNTQRGPLQSSNTPSNRAWMDSYPSEISLASADHNNNNNQQGYNYHPGLNVMNIYPSSSVSGIGYSGLSGFHVPARIRGDEEEHVGYSDEPSSDSRHSEGI